jgi:hypothetical protein
MNGKIGQFIKKRPMGSLLQYGGNESNREEQSGYDVVEIEL